MKFYLFHILYSIANRYNSFSRALFFLSSLEHIPPEERDIEVNQADLKKHLTLIDVDGKATWVIPQKKWNCQILELALNTFFSIFCRVSAWTGQPHTVCLFHKGDRIVGLNDLHITNVKEFNTYISKSLKNEVQSLACAVTANAVTQCHI